MIPHPTLIVADEPVSMIDASRRMIIINLFLMLKEKYKTSFLYITHDLATARHFSDEIIVLNQGRIVEHGTADDVILRPKDPYTRELRAASPDPEKHFGSLAAQTSGGAL